MIGAVKIVSYICSVKKLSEAELSEFENLQNKREYTSFDYTCKCKRILRIAY